MTFSTIRVPLLCLFILIGTACFAQPAWADNAYFNATIGSDGQIAISSGDSSLSDAEDAYANVFNNYKRIAQAISGLCFITSILFLFVYITKLGVSGENLRMRQEALKGILFAGIAVGLFGSIELVVTFFWNLFNGGGAS